MPWPYRTVACTVRVLHSQPAAAWTSVLPDRVGSLSCRADAVVPTRDSGPTWVSSMPYVGMAFSKGWLGGSTYHVTHKLGSGSYGTVRNRGHPNPAAPPTTRAQEAAAT
jgi:hypothetical protein